MKQLTTALFILLLSAQAMGLTGYFLIRKAMIFEKMHKISHFESNQVQQFRYSRAAFQSSFGDDLPDEITIGGNLYDILNIKTSGDSIVMFAVHDSAEEELLAFVQYVFTASDDAANTVPMYALGILTLQYLGASFEIKLKQSVNGYGETPYFFYSVAAACALSTPPPRLIA